MNFWETYKIPLILGGVSLFCIILSIVLLVKSTQSTDPIRFETTSDVLGNTDSNITSSSASFKAIFVDIEGAVMHPGLLSVPAGSRVEDVISAAGGLKNDADALFISQKLNRAMKVADGMKVYIPSKNETSYNIDVAQSSNMNSGLGGTVTSMSINMASKDELDTLTGVGPVTAQKIIDNRPYETLEDLVAKKAVGQAVFEKIRQSISL